MPVNISPWRIVKRLLEQDGAKNKEYDANLDGTVDNSYALQGKTPDDFAPKVHTHTRDQITDLWSTPFWSKIPDKPSSLSVTWASYDSSQRSLGTQYSNGSAVRMVLVTIQFSLNANTSGTITELVNGNTVSSTTFSNSSSNTFNGYASAFILVPPSATYEVSTSGFASTSIVSWVEYDLTL